MTQVAIGLTLYSSDDIVAQRISQREASLTFASGSSGANPGPQQYGIVCGVSSR